MSSVKDKKELCRNWNLYVITDIGMAAPRSYHQIFHEILLGGANVVQLRDKTTPFEILVDVGRKVKPLCEEFGAALIVNDNPYLAKEINADGVHLGQEDMPVDIAREIVGDEKLIGLSTHTKTQAMMSMLMDVDYIGVGPIFPTLTKKQIYEPLGLSMIGWASREIRIPFVPIGGINSKNISDVWRIGKRAPAVVSAIMKAPDLTAATQSLIGLLTQIKQEMQ